MKNPSLTSVVRSVRLAAGSIADPSNFGRTSMNYICLDFSEQDTAAAIEAKRLFLSVYGDRGSEFFVFFGTPYGTFNGASSYKEGQDIHIDYHAADEHRLMALALLITLLEDGFFD